MQEFKRCPKCLLDLSSDKFYKIDDETLHTYCIECHRDYTRNYYRKDLVLSRQKKREWYQKNKDHVKQREKDWAIRTGYNRKPRTRKITLEKSREYGKRRWAKLRERLLIEFGHICACCGETKKEFLALDHVKNDGHEHRKIKNLRSIYQEALRSGKSSDRFRILCHNCNQSLGYYGYCPHENLEKV